MATIPDYVVANTLDRGGTRADVAADTINALRDLAGQTVGLWPRVTATIASGVIAPWTGTGATITAGAQIRVDTEASAPSDDLDRIDPTGLLDTGSSSACRLLLLSSVDAARVVTLRHAQGGTGEIRTPDGANWSLTSPDLVLLLLWDPAATPKCWNVLGWLGSPRDLPTAQRIRLAGWATAGRPATPLAGQLGLNTDRARPEIYTGSTWAALLGPPDFTGTIALQTGAVAYPAVAHGLGAAPSLERVTLECIGAEHGYTVGDEIALAGARSGDGTPVVAVAWTATSCLISQRGTVRAIRRDSPNNDAALDVGKWRWRLRAWR